METYGGDDPHDPSVNKRDLIPFEGSDPLKVTWDGPNDPDNPQNWSKSYKWLITVICCVLTFNVYVVTLDASGRQRLTCRPLISEHLRLRHQLQLLLLSPMTLMSPLRSLTSQHRYS